MCRANTDTYCLFFWPFIASECFLICKTSLLSCLQIMHQLLDVPFLKGSVVLISLLFSYACTKQMPVDKRNTASVKWNHFFFANDVAPGWRNSQYFICIHHKVNWWLIPKIILISQWPLWGCLTVVGFHLPMDIKLSLRTKTFDVTYILVSFPYLFWRHR